MLENSHVRSGGSVAVSPWIDAGAITFPWLSCTVFVPDHCDYPATSLCLPLVGAGIPLGVSVLFPGEENISRNWDHQGGRQVGGWHASDGALPGNPTGEHHSKVNGAYSPHRACDLRADRQLPVGILCASKIALALCCGGSN